MVPECRRRPGPRCSISPSSRTDSRPADVFHTYEKAGRIAKLFWSVAEDCQVLLDPDCYPGAAERPPAVLYLPDGYEVSPDVGPVRPHHDPWDAVALLMSALTRPG